MKVPFFDLKIQYSHIKEEVNAAIKEVIDSQWFILGPKVEELEEALVEYLGVKHAIGVSSGTDALIASLMALEIGADDEVITTPFTFVATAEAIARVGAIPVFVDIVPETFNLDPERIEEAITKKTKAIIPVHCFGQCANMYAINLIAEKHNLAVIEDAAQAIGAKYMNMAAGTMGDLGCFSFFPSKNLGGYGDGGLVTTKSELLFEQIMKLRNHGRGQDKYRYELIGGNFRLDSIQAAILFVKLKYLYSWTWLREGNANFYTKLFKTKQLSDFVQTPTTKYVNKHVYNQYVIRVKNRNALQKYLTAHGIGTAVYWDCPLHRQECFQYLGYRRDAFPESMKAADEVLALPIYPELSSEQQEYVVNVIEEFYRYEKI